MLAGAATTQIPGCFGWAHRVSDPTGTLIVENDDDISHDIHVKVTLTEQEVAQFERTFSLSSADEHIVSDIVGEERYEVTAELDTGESATHRWLVSACDEVRFRIRITGERELRLRQLDFCD